MIIRNKGQDRINFSFDKSTYKTIRLALVSGGNKGVAWYNKKGNSKREWEEVDQSGTMNV
jgi:hypothetical protein